MLNIFMLYMCHIDFEDKSTGWTRPPCQKEYVDAVQLRPRPTAPLKITKLFNMASAALRQIIGSAPVI